MEHPTLWNKEYLKQFENKYAKKDLNSRVNLSYLFKSMRKPLDSDLLNELCTDIYSKKKIPKTLINSISEYQKREKDKLDFVDLLEMYYSIESIFDGKVDSSNLRKWRKANGLSFFGICQFELMEKYYKKSFHH